VDELCSCYFHSSLAALAKAAPETLRSAISQNAGGGYTVRFFQGPGEIVFPADVESSRTHSYDHSEGNWVLVLMRGYAQRAVRQGLVTAIKKSDVISADAKPVALSWLDHSGPLLVAYDRAIRLAVSQDGKLDKATFQLGLATQMKALSVPAAEAAMLVGFLDDTRFFLRLSNTVRQDGEVFVAYKASGQGGLPVRVIEAFMGNAYVLFVADNEMTMKYLRRLHQGGMAMVAVSWGVPPSADYASANWWVNDHAYTVLDYDEATQTVSMRNPWGSHPYPDGFFTLPLAKFLKSFESCSFSETPAK